MCLGQSICWFAVVVVYMSSSQWLWRMKFQGTPVTSFLKIILFLLAYSSYWFHCASNGRKDWTSMPNTKRAVEDAAVI